MSEPAYRSLGTGHYAAVLGALAGGDLFGDGRLEVVADDNQGNVYAWDQHGRLVFHAHTNPNLLRRAAAPVPHGPPGRPRPHRAGVPERAGPGKPGRGHGRQADGGLDIIAASEDRHVYAWHADGRPVAGFPVLVADPDKVATVDPVTNHVTFKNVDSNPGLDEDQGKIIDTPAVADIDGGRPSIIVGTNEEYPAGTGDEGPVNINPSNPLLTSLAAQAGQLKLANGRVYAIKPDGTLQW